MLFPPPGAPSIRYTLPCGGGGGSTTKGCSGSGKRSLEIKRRISCDQELFQSFPAVLV